MWKETIAWLGGLAAGALALSVVFGLAFANMQGGSASAQAEPEMALQIGDCTDECDVPKGETFIVSVVAPTLPEGGIRSFQTEFFTGGMRYLPGPCENEVVMEPLEICLGPNVLPAGQVGYGGVTGIGASPPASNSFNLVEIPLSCPVDGTFGFVPDETYEVAVSTWPSSLLGSRYIDAAGTTVAIRSVGTRDLEILSDVDPDKIVTVELEIAAAVTVNCVEAMAEQPTEVSDGATPTPGVDLPTTGGPGSLDTDGGAGALLWVAIVALAAGFLAIGGAGIHRYYRSRRAA